MVPHGVVVAVLVEELASVVPLVPSAALRGLVYSEDDAHVLYSDLAELFHGGFYLLPDVVEFDGEGGALGAGGAGEAVEAFGGFGRGRPEAAPARGLWFGFRVLSFGVGVGVGGFRVRVGLR